MDTTKDEEASVVIGGDDPQGEFQSRLLACWQSIDALAFELAERYDLMVILAALAEHAGVGLLALMQHRKGGAPQALRIMNRMEKKAFQNGCTE